VHGGGGTDVSEAQGDVPWRSLAQAKLPFVFIKATEGTTLIDPKFEQNWRMAKMCGIPRGAYHVIHPFEPTAEQAKFYLAQLQGDYGELPPVLDIELPTGEPFPPPESYVDSVTTWLDMVQQASGHKGMLYFEHWYYQDILGASPKLHPYRIWAAQYNDHMPEGFVKWPWSFWQHDKPVSWAERMWDQDRFNGTQKQLTDAIAKGWN
jgi:lysozyme